MDWKTILTSTVVAAIVAAPVSLIVAFLNAFVTRRGAERAIQMQNVTQERAKWRDKLRTKAGEVHEAAYKGETEKLDRLRMDFALHLNPFHAEDCAILDVIRKVADEGKSRSLLEEFSDRLALLLKHDWERAKREAEGKCPPGRESYADFKLRNSI